LTSRNLLQHVLERLEDDPPVFFHDEVVRLFGPAQEGLRGLNLLTEVDPSHFAVCPHCDYRGRVTRLAAATGSASRAHLACPTCGPVKVLFDRLRRWAVNQSNLYWAIKECVQIPGLLHMGCAQRLWELGNVKWDGRCREVYVASGPEPQNNIDLIATLARSRLAVCFLPTSANLNEFQAVCRCPMLALDKVLGLDPKGLRFDTALVETHLNGIEKARPRLVKRPKKKRGESSAWPRG
jgi:hypothetical protein